MDWGFFILLRIIEVLLFDNLTRLKEITKIVT